jgi:hypothetical protein
MTRNKRRANFRNSAKGRQDLRRRKAQSQMASQMADISINNGLICLKP